MTDHLHALRRGGRLGAGHLVEVRVAPHANGQVPIGMLQQAVDQLRRLLPGAINNIENPRATLGGQVRCHDFPFLPPLWRELHREAEDLDLLFRHARRGQHPARRFIGHRKKIAGSPWPGGILHDGIGHKRDEREIPRPSVSINLFDQEAVDRAGRNHHVGLHSPQHVAEGKAKPGQAVNLALDKLGTPEQLIKAMPEPGSVADGSLIRMAHQVVEAAVTRVEQVKDLHACFLGSEMLNCLANIPCGDVFPFAETGR